MVRTVISLDPEDKAWLDETARARGTTMTSVVREAVSKYRTENARHLKPLREALEATRGIWTKGDGLSWQVKSRSEWDDR